MADLLVFIPGVLGSTLNYVRPAGAPGGPVSLWVNGILLATCKTEDLKIVNGVGVRPLEPAGVYADTYAPVVRTLIALTRASPVEGFPPFGELVTLAYDWRFSIQAIATDGVKTIMAEHARQKADKIRIVAHSMGGLVARGIYRIMKEAGSADLIKRIVTAGTPHLGSTSPAETFIGKDSIIKTLANAKSSVNLGSVRASSSITTCTAQVVQAAATWPSLYDLLPDPDQNPDNVIRSDLLYLASSYPTAHQVSETELARAKITSWKWLNSADYVPPPEVLCMTFGIGYRTPNGCTPAGNAGKYTPGIRLLWPEPGGDTRVTEASATWESLGQEYARVAIATDHEGLVKNPTALREMVALVVADVPPGSSTSPGGSNPSYFGGYREPPSKVDPGPQAHVQAPNVVGHYGQSCDFGP